MRKISNQVKAKAKFLWDSGKALEAGRLLFNTIDSSQRVDWAGLILKMVILKLDVRSKPINDLLEIIDDSTKWKYAHIAFMNIRTSVLEYQKRPRSDCEEREYAVLYLAEVVAKIIYNETHPVDPFDEDSGWWIASCLKDVVDLVVEQETFVEEALSALFYEYVG